MNLAKWLQKLAAAASASPSELTIEAYLEELTRWRLSDEQWEDLRRRAALRHRYPGRLPMLAELDDIRGELAHEAALRADDEHRDAIEQGERVPCPPELKPLFQGFRRVK